MTPFISNLFNLPVTRKEILERAKKYGGKGYLGLCLAIDDSLFDYGLFGLKDVFFSKFTREDAKPFGGRIGRAFWWPIGEWNTGRMDFLNWLIDEYKDDKTNLRKL